MLRIVTVLGVLLAAVCTPVRAEPPPAEAYGRLPAVEKMSLSPAGDRFAFIAVVKEDRKLVVATADGQTVLFSGDVGNAKVLDIDWVGQDDLLVRVLHTMPVRAPWASVGVEDWPTTLVVNIKTQNTYVLFREDHAVYPLPFGPYGTAKIDGRWYAYFGAVSYDPRSSESAIDHGHPDLYQVDLDTGKAAMVAHGYRDLGGWVMSPDGQVLARTSRRIETGEWSLQSGKFGGKTLASGKSMLSGVYAVPGRTADTVLMELPADHGETYQELSLDGDPAKSGPKITDADGILRDPVTNRWVGVLRSGDTLTPSFFDPQAEARVRGMMKAFPGLSVRLESFTPDLSRMIVQTSGKGDSGTFWLVDIATGQASIIGLAYPDVKDEYVGPIEMVDWKAADGLRLHGVLNLPPGREAKNLPVIVMPHGGPEARDYPEFWWWSQMFAARGYAVFQPNFRGSSGYGAAFRDAGFGEWGRKMQTDVSDGLAALVDRGIVDPKRACIVGWSYGGYAAEAGITLQHGLYRCAVSMAGVSDLPGMFDDARNWEDNQVGDAERYWKKFWGVTSISAGVLKTLSPAKRAGEAEAPILLIHGKDDTVVPIAQSREMAAALKAAGKDVEFVTLPNADHWLLHEDTRLAMAKASLDFVLKHNPPDPAPATAVAEAGR